MEKTTNIIGKKELVKIVASKTEAVAKFNAVVKCIDAVFESIEELVSKGDRVQIKDFGTFKPVAVAERQGRNPQTSEEITIPAHKKSVFTPSKHFKEKVNVL